MNRMAIPATTVEKKGPSRPSEPLLEAGDRLSRDEFGQRYERMRSLKEAELIEGIVYISPVLSVLRRGLDSSEHAGFVAGR